MKYRRFVLVLLLATTLALAPTAFGDTPWNDGSLMNSGSPMTRDAEAWLVLKDRLDEKDMTAARKLDSALRSLVAAELTAADPKSLSKEARDLAENLSEVYYSIGDRLIVDVTVTSHLNAVIEALEELDGVDVQAVAPAGSYDLISVLAPAERLLDVVRAEGVVAGHAVIGQTGSASAGPSPEDDGGFGLYSWIDKFQGVSNNQAEAELEVEALRRVLPAALGTGIRIGTLSDTVNKFAGGLSDSQGSGDLPSGGAINVIADAPSGEDEGRAMMEHIYDIAPGVNTLGFATATTGEASFAANITALANAGMDIINDDVVYYREPFFQDGPVAQAVTSFIDSGGIYFSLNHNFANNSYENTWESNFGSPLYHDFAMNDELQNFTLPAGTDLYVSLQWAQPWGAATSDFDLEVWDLDSEELVAWSNDSNIGSNPSEYLFYPNTTDAPLNLGVGVKRVAGTSTGVNFKYILFHAEGPRPTITQYQAQASGTLTPHAATTKSIAIGAAPFFARDVIEPFSGRGPHRQFFTPAGNPVGPLTLEKPDFTSIDGCNTTFYYPGEDSTADTDTLPNFFGTSAATPNAAAVAALILQLAGGPGSMDQQDIKDVLKASVMDLGVAGHDTTFGHGRINALGAAIVATGPRSTEYWIHPNQFGDAELDQNLFSTTDIDRIRFAFGTGGSTVVDVLESHPDMDPMLAVFQPDFDVLIDLAYDGGVGDDARSVFETSGGFSYVAEVLTESDFSGAADFTLVVNGPNQNVVDRTAQLDGSGNDLGVAGSIVLPGESDYFSWTAPFAGSLTVDINSTGWTGYFRVYDSAGVSLGAAIGSGDVTLNNVLAGQEFVVQVVPVTYVETGSYLLNVDFSPTGPALIFEDGFESGNTSQWSQTSP